MKRCSKCGEDKPLEDFPLAKSKKSGRHSHCKPCHAAYVRARYHADPSIRERAVERQREDYAVNPEKYRERTRDQYRNDPDAWIAKVKAWQDANPDKVRAYKRKYDKTHPEKVRANVRKRRARIAQVEHAPYRERDIYQRDEGRCCICRRDLAYAERSTWELDHIVPIVLGGPDTPANVQLTCRPCNREKWTRLEGQIHMAV